MCLFILSCVSFLNAFYVLYKALWISLLLKGCIQINLPNDPSLNSVTVNGLRLSTACLKNKKHFSVALFKRCVKVKQFITVIQNQGWNTEYTKLWKLKKIKQVIMQKACQIINPTQLICCQRRESAIIVSFISEFARSPVAATLTGAEGVTIV